MIGRSWIVMTVALLTLGGCVGTRGEPPVLAALDGGLIAPSVAASLDPGDRRRALEVEYRTLEIVPGGQIVTWTGERDGVHGKVYAAQPYTVGGRNCRQYVHVVTVDGRTTTARGAACRDSAGLWAPVI